MGLDAYVNVKKAVETTEELWYGRKENAIHGWMQRYSGVNAEDFNCKPLPLTRELLDEFEKDLKDNKVSSTSGFFFGGEQDATEINAAAKKLLTVSREALARGEEPYYDSWW